VLNFNVYTVLKAFAEKQPYTDIVATKNIVNQYSE